MLFKKFIVRREWLWFAALLATTVGIQAQTYHVRAGATGSGNGSDWNNAYPSLPATMQRGATYYIADGSYGSYTFDDPASGTTPVTIRKATVANHGTSAGWSDNYGDGQATFGGITIASPYLILDGQTRTETTRMEAPSGYGFRATDLSANSSSGENASYSQISYMELGGTWNESGSPDCSAPSSALYFVYDQNNITFTRCIFHNAGVNNGAIAMMHGSRDITFDHCDFYMGWGKATIAAPNVGITRLTVKYCRFWDSTRRDTCPAAEGTGITCEIGSYSTGAGSQHNGNVVYGNIFYGTASGGRNTSVQFGDASPSGGTALNCKVFNNTFVGFPEVSVLADILLFSGSGNEARNNLFYNTGSSKVTANSVSHNVTASSSPFVNYSTRDFRLAQSMGGGTSLGAPYNTGPDGNTRGGDGLWDVGAYEFNSGPDISAPLVTGVAASSITTNSATVSFTTSESARSGVEFGLTTAYGTSVTNSTLLISHSFQLNGLSPATTYHYRVHVTDAAGNRTNSADFTFQTSVPDTNAPVISGLGAINIAGSTATITFNTSESALSGVEYGLTTSYGGGATNTALATSHSFTLTGLSPSTTYHYRVSATDAAGNGTVSGDATFLTTTPDTIAPTISLTSPADGATVSNTITLTATASDNVGVVGVSFLVDGAVLGVEDTTAPYSLAWNSATVANGTHSLAARARDAEGNQTTSTAISITVASVPTGELKVGDQIVVNSSPSLRVRSTSALAGTIVGDQLNGALGTIIGGPVNADGYTWWQIDYVSAPDGWSIEGTSTAKWLILDPVVRPAPPTGLRVVGQ